VTVLLLAILAPHRRLSSHAVPKPAAGLLVIKHNRIARSGTLTPLILRDEGAAGPAPAPPPFN
jgi:hypothetical protein